MSESKLDQLVKGAPSPDKALPAIPSSGVITASSPAQLADPLASLPSSPPQIYLNLLILEASLRAQYLELRARRRQYTFFLTLLGLWNLYFAYALFLAPREDGSGVGGSVYWVIEVTEKVAFMGGIVTGILVWGTGQWERGIRWPRRWVGITNRGLRGFNCKIVVVKGPWWKEWLSTLLFLISNGLFLSSRGSSYRYIDPALQSSPSTSKSSKSGLPNIHEDDTPSTRSREEDLAPGGDTIKLLLLPKPFSPAFRENWDLYRTEYWERENERRRLLLQRLKIHDKTTARLQPRPSFLSRFRFRGAKPKDVEKSHHGHGLSHSHSLREKEHRHSASVAGVSEKRLRAGSTRSGSHSRTSSRSTTPTPDLDASDLSSGASLARRSSTASTSSNSSSLRTKKRPGSTAGSAAGGARIQKLTPSGTREAQSGGGGAGTVPEKHTVHSPLARENSFSSISTDAGSSRPTTPADAEFARSSLRMSGGPAGEGKLG
jgi:uncharacterized membrane protein (DUF485 family)